MRSGAATASDRASASLRKIEIIGKKAVGFWAYSGPYVQAPFQMLRNLEILLREVQQRRP